MSTPTAHQQDMPCEKSDLHTQALIASSIFSRRTGLPWKQVTQLLPNTVFQNVSPQEFEHKIFPKNFKATGCARFCYSTETNDLFTKTLGQGHALIIGMFRSFLVIQFIRLGLEPEDFTNRISPLNTLGSWKRQPDSCWGPAGRGAPITAVLEVGMAEHESGLYRSAYEWIQTPGGDFSTVITICAPAFQPGQWKRAMTVTKWETLKVKRGRGMVPTATRNSTLTINSQDKTITGVAISIRNLGPSHLVTS